jgi:hypothetical protein
MDTGNRNESELATSRKVACIGYSFFNGLLTAGKKRRAFWLGAVDILLLAFEASGRIFGRS